MTTSETNPYAAANHLERPAIFNPACGVSPLLSAYVAHHLAGVGGLILGGLANLPMLIWIFPIHKSWIEVSAALLLPPFIDLYLLVEPLSEGNPAFLPLMIFRCLVTCATFGCMAIYGWRPSLHILLLIILLTGLNYFTITCFGFGAAW